MTLSRIGLRDIFWRSGRWRATDRWGWRRLGDDVSATYRALACDVASGEHTVPDFNHAVRLTRLLDDLVQSAKNGYRSAAQDWPVTDA
jgi:predicted dehydrogenase